MSKTLKGKAIRRKYIFLTLIIIGLFMVFFTGFIIGSYAAISNESFFSIWLDKNSFILSLFSGALTGLLSGGIVSGFFYFKEMNRETDIWSRNISVELRHFIWSLDDYISNKCNQKELTDKYYKFTNEYFYGTNRFKFFLKRNYNKLLDEIYSEIIKMNNIGILHKDIVHIKNESTKCLNDFTTIQNKFDRYWL